MATATKNVVEVPDPPYTVTLELSQDEAEHLRWVLGQVTAQNETTVSVWSALKDIGVMPTRPKYNPFISVDKAPFRD